MQHLKIGVHVVAPDAPALIDGIAAADAAGLDVAWLTVGGPAPDPFAVFAAAAARAPRIHFGTSIVPTFPRHPLAMAQAAMTVDQIAPGRFRLGVGPQPQARHRRHLGHPLPAPPGPPARIPHHPQRRPRPGPRRLPGRDPPGQRPDRLAH